MRRTKNWRSWRAVPVHSIVVSAESVLRSASPRSLPRSFGNDTPRYAPGPGSHSPGSPYGSPDGSPYGSPRPAPFASPTPSSPGVCPPPPTNGDPWADFPGRLLKLQRGLRRRYNSAPPNVFYNTLCPVCPFVLGSKRATTGCFLTRKEFRPPWWVSRPHTLATTKHQSHPLHANQKVRNEPGKKKGSQGSPMVPSA